MSTVSEVTLDGPMPAWGDGVLRARWDGRLAAALQGPPSVDPAALAMAQRRAAPWVGRDLPGVVALWGVARANGRECWFHERPQGVSAAVLAQHEDRLPPPRTAAELVASTADVLLRIGPEIALVHPGPRPMDVLLDDAGHVLLAGFVGPELVIPNRRAPGADREASLVWRLGVLLAELLSGRAPAVPVDASTQRGLLRRLFVRILSRPGPPLPEPFREVVAAMLAWDEDRRPAWAEVPAMLREVASMMAGPVLGEWSATFLPATRRRLEAEWEIPAGEPRPQDPIDLSDQTEESDLPQLMLPDEVTAASPGNGISRPRLAEQGAIPVDVGPPPHAVPSWVRLPADLFDPEATDGRATVPALLPRHAAARAWWAVGMALVAIAVLFVGAWVAAS